jgi:tetratricopeptide (TPR) repeat protein
MKGRYDQAIEDLSKIRAMEPGFSWTHYYLAASHLQVGQKEQAVKEMQEAARLGNREARRWLRENGLE